MQQHQRMVLISAMSALLYGGWGSLLDLAMRSGDSIPLVGTLLFGIGAVISLIGSRGRVERPNKMIVLGAVAFFVANAELLYVMRHTELDSAYVFVPSSMLVFFGLTALRYRPSTSAKKRATAAVLLAVLGMTLAEMSGVSVNAWILFVGLTLTLVYGVASYAVIAQMLSKPSAEAFWASLIQTVLFGAFLLLMPASPSLELSLYSLGAGILVVFGFQLELESVAIANRSASRFTNLNLVNVIANMDSVVVIAFSVLIGTATLNGVLGLLLVFVSVSVLYPSQS